MADPTWNHPGSSTLEFRNGFLHHMEPIRARLGGRGGFHFD